MRDCLDEGLLQSFCDGEASPAQAEKVTSHLATCNTCSLAMEELIGAGDLVTTALAHEFQVGVPTERLRQRIDAAIAAEQRDARSLKNESGAGWFSSLSNLFAFRQPVLGYASLVAVLAFTSIFGIAYFRSVSEPAPPAPDTVASGNAPTKVEATPVESAPSENEVSNPSESASVSQPEINTSRRVSRRPRPSVPDTTAKVKLLPGERSYLRTIAALDSTIKATDKPMRPELQAEYERNLALVNRALAAARNAAKENPDDPDVAEFVYTAYQSKVDLLNTVADARVYNRRP